MHDLISFVHSVKIALSGFSNIYYYPSLFGGLSQTILQTGQGRYGDPYARAQTPPIWVWQAGGLHCHGHHTPIVFILEQEEKFNSGA